MRLLPSTRLGLLALVAAATLTPSLAQATRFRVKARGSALSFGPTGKIASKFRGPGVHVTGGRRKSSVHPGQSLRLDFAGKKLSLTPYSNGTSLLQYSGAENSGAHDLVVLYRLAGKALGTVRRGRVTLTWTAHGKKDQLMELAERVAFEGRLRGLLPHVERYASQFVGDPSSVPLQESIQRHALDRGILIRFRDGFELGRPRSITDAFHVSFSIDKSSLREGAFTLRGKVLLDEGEPVTVSRAWGLPSVTFRSE